jgi:deoxyribodipyrimidine photolyase
VCFFPVWQEGQTAGGAGLVGGEEEALKRLQKFALDVPSQTTKSKASSGQSEPGGDSLYGANFSCKISPWLALGCLSPRRMFEDLKKNASRFAP